MATVETIYMGGLRTEATHVQSGTKIVTDAPTDNHGKGDSFSPTDLVSAALGSCMMTLMGIAADTHGINVDGTRLSITKVMAADPRRIGEIVIDVHFPSRRCIRTASRRSVIFTRNSAGSEAGRSAAGGEVVPSVPEDCFGQCSLSVEYGPAESVRDSVFRPVRSGEGGAGSCAEKPAGGFRWHFGFRHGWLREACM